MIENESGAIALEGALDLAAAQPLAQRLMTQTDSDLRLDASGASRLGASCAQVLLSARDMWQRGGKSFRIENPSAEFQESIRLLGLGPRLLGEI